THHSRRLIPDTWYLVPGTWYLIPKTYPPTMHLLSDLHHRLRVLFSRTREDRELDEELAFHLDMQTQANIARGMSPEEARRQAHLALGGLAQVREATRDARGVRWLDDAVADVQLALRT